MPGIKRYVYAASRSTNAVYITVLLCQGVCSAQTENSGPEFRESATEGSLTGAAERQRMHANPDLGLTCPGIFSAARSMFAARTFRFRSIMKTPHAHSFFLQDYRWRLCQPLKPRARHRTHNRLRMS